MRTPEQVRKIMAGANRILNEQHGFNLPTGEGEPAHALKSVMVEIRKETPVESITKSDHYAKIRRDALALYPGKTPEAAVATYITKDTAGRAAYEAYRSARGASLPVEKTEVRDLRKGAAPAPGAVPSAGGAYSIMLQMAKAEQKPGETEAASFTRVYAREHRLREIHKMEMTQNVRKALA